MNKALPPFIPPFEPYTDWDQVPEILYQEWTNDHYDCFKLVTGRGLCCVCPFMYTVDLLVDLTPLGYAGRYAFPTWGTAARAICAWDGTGHPGNDWLYHYGGTEGKYPNPLAQKQNLQNGDI